MNGQKGAMPLFDHIEELRQRLTRIVIVNLIAIFALFSFSDRILQYAFALNPGMQLVYLTPSEMIIVLVKTAAVAGIVLLLPYTLYEVIGFIASALTDTEKRIMRIGLLAGFVFFLSGVFFSYKVALPFTLRFFMTVQVEEVKAMISVDAYVNFINKALLSFGFVFEMPVFSYLLGRIGVLTHQTLEQSRRYIIVAIFIIAAALTPPDVISQISMAVPMLLLLEVSIRVVKVGERHKRVSDQKLHKEEMA